MVGPGQRSSRRKSRHVESSSDCEALVSIAVFPMAEWQEAALKKRRWYNTIAVLPVCTTLAVGR